MNNKIPFHELSARVAATTGISPESAESFVKSFFEILSESLVKGESVRVKGLGSFTVSVTNGEKTVDFILDKDLSESMLHSQYLSRLRSMTRLLKRCFLR